MSRVARRAFWKFVSRAFGRLYVIAAVSFFNGIAVAFSYFNLRRQLEGYVMQKIAIAATITLACFAFSSGAKATPINGALSTADAAASRIAISSRGRNARQLGRTECVLPAHTIYSAPLLAEVDDSEAKNNRVHVRNELFSFAWLGVLAGPGVGFWLTGRPDASVPPLFALCGSDVFARPAASSLPGFCVADVLRRTRHQRAVRIGCVRSAGVAAVARALRY